jgi:ribonuclease-3
MNRLRKNLQNPVLRRQDFFDTSTILGFRPKDLNYYRTAFTHRSSSRLDLSGIINYERLGSRRCNVKSNRSVSLFAEAPHGDEVAITRCVQKS